MIITRGRYVTGYKVASSEMMRLASSKLLGFYGCLLPSAEVLTPYGWVSFRHFEEGTTAMQWHPQTKELSWCVPKLHSVEFSGSMVTADATLHRLSYTPDHRIPTIIDGQIEDKRAVDVANFSECYIPIAGKFSQGSFHDPELLRMLAMVHADGSAENGSIRLTFHKERKKKRYIELATRNKIPIITHSAPDNATRFYIPVNYAHKYLDNNSQKIGADAWLLSYDKESIEAYLDEIKYWDATIRSRSFQFFTVNKRIAEWVQIAAHVTGKSATINFNTNSSGYGRYNNQGIWLVNVKPRDYLISTYEHFYRTEYTGKVYCLRTPTTYFIVRDNNRVLITGNSNHQNPSESLMSCVVPEDGNIFVSPDQAGAEALVVAMECRPGRMRKLFDLGIKPHSYMALQLFTDKFRKGQPASRYKGVDPEVFSTYPECRDLLKAIKNAVREYFLGKKTIHSFNYQEGPRTFQMTTLEESGGTIVLSFKESKEFHTIWAETFTEVVEWQGDTIARQKRDRVLHNLFGFPRRFDRLWNDSVERQGLAYVPQSTVAVITHKAFASLFWRIRKEKLPWTLLNNKHDSFLLECPEAHKEQAIEYSKQHMGQELTSSRGEKYFMKVGVSAGHNWGHYDEELKPIQERLR